MSYDPIQNFLATSFSKRIADVSTSPTLIAPLDTSRVWIGFFNCADFDMRVQPGNQLIRDPTSGFMLGWRIASNSIGTPLTFGFGEYGPMVQSDWYGVSQFTSQVMIIETVMTQGAQNLWQPTTRTRSMRDTSALDQLRDRLRSLVQTTR